MGASESDGGMRGWWEQERPTGAASHWAHAQGRQHQTIGKPPGQIPSQHPEIVNLPAGYGYSHTSLPCAESFTLDISAQDSEHDSDYDPDMLPDEETSTA